MELCISLVPEQDLKKKIDDLRYRFDRPLLREKYPYINLIGPVESYLNLKKAVAEFFQFAKNRKRFRITTDVVGYMEIDHLVFLNVADKGGMKDYYDFILENYAFETIPFFFPHIVIARNHSPEELSQIYEELQGFEFQYSFFPETITVYTKEEKYWEEYTSLTL